MGGHPLVRHGGQEARQLTTVGQPQLWFKLEQRLEHEAPARDLRVRKRQALRSELQVAQQQKVQVDRPRAVADAAGGPAELALDLLARIEQPFGIE